MTAQLRALPARVRKLTLTPSQYAIAAYVAVGAFTLIVMSGAAVRLTGSGLGCPRWPRCYGKVYPPLEAHALIEFSNRMVTIPVTIAAFSAFVLALRRRPYRRDLVRIGALLPLGVLSQAVLGGLTVRGELAYGWVMGHFALSMLVLAAAVTLAWRATHEPGERLMGRERLMASDRSCGDDRRRAAPPRAAVGDRWLVWAARACLVLGALTIFLGTAATAAGPHAGGAPGERISRLRFDGHSTMDFVIHRHGEIALAFGLVALCFWWLSRRTPDARLRRSTTALCALIALQGLVGLDQYKTHLPTELVWVHVSLAALTWVTALWSTFAAGGFALHAASIDLRKPSEGSTLAPAARTRSASQLSEVTTLTEPG